jgi:DNA-binding NtrC family response regulator
VRKITLESLRPQRIDRQQQSRKAVLSSPILLIDKQLLFLKVLAACFHQRGFTEVFMATNATTALDWVIDSKPGLIVIDRTIVCDDGRPLVDVLEQNSQCKNSTVMSVASSQSDASASVGGDVFCKPVNIGQMVDHAIEELTHSTLRMNVTATARRNRAMPASQAYDELRKIVGRPE